MSPERKPKQNLPENRPNASMSQPKLDAILTATRDRVASLRTQARELERRAAAAPKPLPFARALAGRDVGVIAEVKRRSPSAGAIREDLDAVALVPRGVPVIAESGIATRADVERMAAAGADLVLVGTSVAGNADPERAVRELTGVRRQGRGR